MTMASLKALSALSLEVEQKGQTLTDVMFLCDEWKSSKGGLSTFNREFAINLAAATTGSMKIHCYVLKSDDQDIEDAKQHGVNLITAQTVPGSRDPIDWLKVPPPELQHPHIVIGHGRKLGRPAFFIARATGCQWIQFVHFFCEDLWKYKEIATAVDTIEEIEEKHKLEIDLCRAADAVVAVGSHLQQKYSRSLPNVKVEIITPGIFEKFSGELKFAMRRSVPLVKNFSVFLFRADPLKDLSLKGYDIIANAVGSLGKNFELTFVGSSPGEHRKVERWFLDNTCINRNQLTIHGYCSGQEELKMMFYQSDLVALPSSTEGFGLVGLQVISAGVPLLVSGESGIGEALKEVEGGDTVIVGSDKDANEWAQRIWEKSTERPEDREASAMKLRENYRKVYSWKKECERFILMIKEVLKNADESTGFQKDQQRKDSNTSATEGSIVHPETEDLQALLKFKFLSSIAMKYLEAASPQSLEQLEMLIQYLRGMKTIMHVSYKESTGFQKDQQQKDSDTSATAGSIVHPETEDLQALLKFKFLSLIAMSYFEITPPQSLEELKKFIECLRGMKEIIGVPYEESTGFQKDQQQKDSDTSATAVSLVHPETEDPQALQQFKFLSLVAMKYLKIILPQSLKELEEFIEYLREVKAIIAGVSYEGTSPSSDMFTISHEKEQELPETMRHQERKESTGFQKDQQQKDSATSATEGSIVHPETEDLQAPLQKFLSLIAKNCLETISPQSMEEWNNLIEYLSEVKAAVAGVLHEEAAGFQKDQHQKASAASTTAGSILHPKTKDFLALKQKILQLSAMNYFKTTPLHSIKESNEFKFSIGNNKISVGKSKITKDGGVLIVQNVPSRVMFPPKALSTCTEVTCSLWNLQILSPPLGRNEALVSSVMELACGSLLGTEKRYEFNVKVKLALSYSASDIKGYELVIKELINEKTNDWRDLETRWAWTSSDIKDEHSSVEEFPDWLFPFAEAEITRFSSFAVVWRLKSFTFKSPSTLSSSFPCILSDHPEVSVTLPVSSLPTGKTFALTVKVQEIPCNDTVLKELVVAGPILHISPSEPVQLLAPTRLTIPVSLREDIPKFPDYSATDIRIFCRTSEEDESEWNEVTEQLENKAVLKNGTVTFTVNHFSMYWVWIDLLKLPFDILKHLVDYLSGKSMLQRVGFFARLYAIGNSTNYVLTLYCFPLHLEEQVHTRTSPTDRCVRAQGEGNSLKPLCKEDQMSVSLSKAFTVTQEENLDNFLTFLGTEPFQRSLPVSVSDLSNLQVELYREKQSYKETLCTLYFIPTFLDQSSSPRNFPSTAQIAMREQKEDQVALEFSTALPSPKASEETDSNNFSKGDLKVTILADEWNSLKGGLSTFNRELAIHLASRSETQVTVLVPHGACGEKEKAAAAKSCVTIVEAKKLIACPPPVELFFPRKDLRIDVIIGHGVKLGQQAQIIRESHDCKWVQVVHTAPDELGMYKDYPKAIAQSEEKNQREVSLCETADLVMAVGPKLKGFYSNHLRSFNKDENVVQFTPGVMRDLTDVKQSPNENVVFQVLMFGRGDDEDFKLKGYDIAAGAFASHELKYGSYHLTLVGAAPGKQDEFAAKILRHGISKKQLSVKEYIKDRNRLKELLLRMDLVIMPSRTEGFGLTALEALSAGLPVLAGHNSGFSEALRKVEFGELCVVNSDEPEDWSKAIKKVRQKERKKRLKEMQRVRESYGHNYNWEEQCEILIREMRRKVFA